MTEPDRPRLAIETVPIDSLIPDPTNVRRHSKRNLEAIAASLRTFGQVVPIVITPAGVIAAGNGTHEAARDILGWTEIDIVRSAPDDPDGARALAIVMNRSAELATWDETGLREQLAELEPAGFTAGTLGFSDQDLRALEPDQAELPDDPIPSTPKDPITKPGDLWVLGDHRLLCGDSTSPEAHARLMGRMKARLCYTDPPYGMSYIGTGHDAIAGDDLRGDELVRFVATVSS